MRFSIPGITVAVLVACCPLWRAHAADPQTYKVNIGSTANGDLDDTLRATSELLSLRTTAPVSPFGLIARARGEIDRLKTVLESFGYYQSAVLVKIDEKLLNDPALADELGALPKGSDAKVAISFELGPLYHLREITIDGVIPQPVAGAFALRSGSPAVAADVLAAGAHLLTALQESGYAFARVDPPVAYEDQIQPVLDVSFHVDAGRRVNIGEIRFEGLKRVHDKVLRRRLMLHTGQQYSGTSVETARRDLLRLAPVAAISVQVGAAVDATGGVPVTFVVIERLRHAVAVTSAYSTDLGGSAEFKWTDRNLFGNAEQLDVAASLINLGGRATNGIGYDTSVKLAFPDFGHRDQSLHFAVGAIKQSLQAYSQEAVSAGVSLNRRLSSLWSASVGMSATQEKIDQESQQFNYTLVSLPLSVSYDSTHLASPLDDPLHGMRDSLSVTPTRALGHSSASFIISQIKLAAYFDLKELGITNPGRTVIAARALAGVAQGANEFSLPPDQRFYGGGSGTVRGYAFQAIGPKFQADGNPVGGTAIGAATLELRQRFAASFGVALFVDVGQVVTSARQLSSDFRVGVGAGVRYYTPIGPIRLDVAVPTKRSKATYQNPSVAPDGTVTNHPLTVADDAFELYIGLGQAF